jgi:hypothetical protein
MTRSAIRLFWRFGSSLDATKFPEILRKVSDPVSIGAAPSRSFRRRFYGLRQFMLYPPVSNIASEHATYRLE